MGLAARELLRKKVLEKGSPKGKGERKTPGGWSVWGTRSLEGRLPTQEGEGQMGRVDLPPEVVEE